MGERAAGPLGRKMSAAFKRTVGPWLLTAYGIGVMVGAGIYVLVGAVVVVSGAWAPLAFLVAGLIALPSAMSYAELSTRFPEASGEAAYVQAGFNRHRLAVLTGLMIVVAGTVSGAAVLRGGVGYLTAIVDVAPWLGIVGLAVFLTGVAIAGALESLVLAAIFTVLEVAGLIGVIYAGFVAPPVITELPLLEGSIALPILMGASLAFFAFIGFEDIVNLAEEVKRPSYSLPFAILVALGITTLLYVAVSWAAIRSVPGDVLVASPRPLAEVWATAGWPTLPLAAIAVIAALNGILAQMIMAARVLFGLGRREPKLGWFTQSHARFGTPVRATVFVAGLVLLGALVLPVAELAEITSMVLLAVFTIVNLALIRIKSSPSAAAVDTPQDGPKNAPQNAPQNGVFHAPRFIPYMGFITALAALILSFGDML